MAGRIAMRALSCSNSIRVNAETRPERSRRRQTMEPGPGPANECAKSFIPSWRLRRLLQIADRANEGEQKILQKIGVMVIGSTAGPSGFGDWVNRDLAARWPHRQLL